MFRPVVRALLKGIASDDNGCYSYIRDISTNSTLQMLDHKFLNDLPDDRGNRQGLMRQVANYVVCSNNLQAGCL